MRVRLPAGHRSVLIDTSVWICHFEQHPQWAKPAGEVIAAVESGRWRGVASELTLLELAVKPLRLGRQDVADECELRLTHFPHLELVPVGRDILLDAAALRARFGLRTPDAIQLATGLHAGATLAVTNDAGWRKVPHLDVLVLADSPA